MIEFLPMVLSPPGVTVPQIQKEHHVAQQTGQTSLEITRNQIKSTNQPIYHQTSTKGASHVTQQTGKLAFMQELTNQKKQPTNQPTKKQPTNQQTNQPTNQSVLHLQIVNQLKEIYSLQRKAMTNDYSVNSTAKVDKSNQALWNTVIKVNQGLNNKVLFKARV